MKKDQAPKTTQSVQKKENVGEAADPRKALFAAIQARGANDGDSSSNKPPAPVDPRQALFAAIKNKGNESSNNTDTPATNVEYSRGVKRLENFLWKADKTFSQTERDQNAAIRACRVSTNRDFCNESINFLVTDNFHLPYFRYRRVLRCIVERKEAKDLHHRCCKFWHPWHYR